jgi:tape measure domain-containing protein
MQIDQITLGLKLDTRQAVAELAKFEQTVNKISQNSIHTKMTKSIVPQVDDSQLTALNKHLDLKVKHLKQVRQTFASSPIQVKFDKDKLQKDIRDINKLRASISTPVRAVGGSSSSQYTGRGSSSYVSVTPTVNIDLDGLAAAFDASIRTMTDVLSTDLGDIIQATLDLKTKRNPLAALASVVTAPLRLATNAATGVVKTTTLALLNGAALEFTKGFTESIKNTDVSGDVEAAFGSIFDTIKTYASKTTKGLATTITQNPEIGGAEFVERSAKQLNLALEGSDITDATTRFRRELIKNAVQLANGSTTVQGILKQKAIDLFNAYPKQGRALANAAFKTASVPFAINNEIQTRIAAEQIKELADNLTRANRTLQAFKELEGIKGNENVVLTVAGFQDEKGNASIEIAEQLRPHFEEGTRFVPIRNTNTDKKKGGVKSESFDLLNDVMKSFGQELPEVFAEQMSHIEVSLSKAFAGIDKDARKMAVVGKMLRTLYPDIKLSAVGFSGGGQPTKQFVELMRAMDELDVSGFAIGTPLLGAVAPTTGFRSALGKGDPQSAPFAKDKLGFDPTLLTKVLEVLKSGNNAALAATAPLMKYMPFEPSKDTVVVDVATHDVQSYINDPVTYQEMSKLIPGMKPLDNRALLSDPKVMESIETTINEGMSDIDSQLALLAEIINNSGGKVSDSLLEVANKLIKSSEWFESQKQATLDNAKNVLGTAIHPVYNSNPSATGENSPISNFRVRDLMTRHGKFNRFFKTQFGGESTEKYNRIMAKPEPERSKMETRYVQGLAKKFFESLSKQAELLDEMASSKRKVFADAITSSLAVDRLRERKTPPEKIDRKVIGKVEKEEDIANAASFLTSYAHNIMNANSRENEEEIKTTIDNLTSAFLDNNDDRIKKLSSYQKLALASLLAQRRGDDLKIFKGIDELRLAGEGKGEKSKVDANYSYFDTQDPVLKASRIESFKDYVSDPIISALQGTEFEELANQYSHFINVLQRGVLNLYKEGKKLSEIEYKEAEKFFNRPDKLAAVPESEWVPYSPKARYLENVKGKLSVQDFEAYNAKQGIVNAGAVKAEPAKLTREQVLAYRQLNKEIVSFNKKLKEGEEHKRVKLFDLRDIRVIHEGKEALTLLEQKTGRVVKVAREYSNVLAAVGKKLSEQKNPVLSGLGNVLSVMPNLAKQPNIQARQSAEQFNKASQAGLIEQKEEAKALGGFLVTTMVEGAEQVSTHLFNQKDKLDDKSGKEALTLIVRMGALLREMHNAGITNPEMTASNILEKNEKLMPISLGSSANLPDLTEVTDEEEIKRLTTERDKQIALDIESAIASGFADMQAKGINISKEAFSLLFSAGIRDTNVNSQTEASETLHIVERVVGKLYKGTAYTVAKPTKTVPEKSPLDIANDILGNKPTEKVKRTPRVDLSQTRHSELIAVLKETAQKATEVETMHVNANIVNIYGGQINFGDDGQPPEGGNGGGASGGGDSPSPVSPDPTPEGEVKKEEIEVTVVEEKNDQPLPVLLPREPIPVEITSAGANESKKALQYQSELTKLAQQTNTVLVKTADTVSAVNKLTAKVMTSPLVKAAKEGYELLEKGEQASFQTANTVLPFSGTIAAAAKEVGKNVIVSKTLAEMGVLGDAIQLSMNGLDDTLTNLSHNLIENIVPGDTTTPTAHHGTHFGHQITDAIQDGFGQATHAGKEIAEHSIEQTVEAMADPLIDHLTDVAGANMDMNLLKQGIKYSTRKAGETVHKDNLSVEGKAAMQAFENAINGIQAGAKLAGNDTTGISIEYLEDSIQAFRESLALNLRLTENERKIITDANTSLSDAVRLIEFTSSKADQKLKTTLINQADKLTGDVAKAKAFKNISTLQNNPENESQAIAAIIQILRRDISNTSNVTKSVKGKQVSAESATRAQEFLEAHEGLVNLTKTLKQFINETDKLKPSEKKVYNALIDQELTSPIAGVKRSSTNELGRAKKAGVEIANGFRDGIRERAALVNNAVQFLAKGAVDEACSILKIKSPSRIFIELGKFVSEGLAIGIENNADLVDESIDNVGTSLIDTFKDVTDINSPSREFQKLGEYIVEGLRLGLDMTQLLADYKAELGELTPDKEAFAQQVAKSFDYTKQTGKRLGNGVASSDVGFKDNVATLGADQAIIEAMRSAQDYSDSFYAEKLKLAKSYEAKLKSLPKKERAKAQILPTPDVAKESNVTKPAPKQNFVQRLFRNSPDTETLTEKRPDVGSILDVLARIAILGTVLGVTGTVLMRFAQTAVLAASEVERLDSTIKFLSSNSVQADSNLKFINDSIADVGLNAMEAKKQYADFLAATQGTALQSSAGFLGSGFIEATAKRGLTRDAQNRAMVAVTQMSSKGILSQEEVRGQLAEALPGSTALLAKSMGLADVRELNKAIEKGVMGAEAIPKFLAAVNLDSAVIDTDLMSFHLSRSQAGIEGIVAQIGARLLPIAKPLVGVFANLVTEINKALSAMSSLGQGTVIVGLTTGIYTAITALIKMDVVVKSIGQFAGNFKSIFANLVGGIKTLAIQTGLWAAAIFSVQAAFDSVMARINNGTDQQIKKLKELNKEMQASYTGADAGEIKEGKKTEVDQDTLKYGARSDDGLFGVDWLSFEKARQVLNKGLVDSGLAGAGGTGSEEALRAIYGDNVDLSKVKDRSLTDAEVRIASRIQSSGDLVGQVEENLLLAQQGLKGEIETRDNLITELAKLQNQYNRTTSSSERNDLLNREGGILDKQGQLTKINLKIGTSDFGVGKSFELLKEERDNVKADLIKTGLINTEGGQALLARYENAIALGAETWAKTRIKIDAFAKSLTDANRAINRLKSGLEADTRRRRIDTTNTQAGVIEQDLTGGAKTQLANDKTNLTQLQANSSQTNTAFQKALDQLRGGNVNKILSAYGLNIASSATEIQKVLEDNQGDKNVENAVSVLQETQALEEQASSSRLEAAQLAQQIAQTEFRSTSSLVKTYNEAKQIAANAEVNANRTSIAAQISLTRNTSLDAGSRAIEESKLAQQKAASISQGISEAMERMNAGLGDSESQTIMKALGVDQNTGVEQLQQLLNDGSLDLKQQQVINNLIEMQGLKDRQLQSELDLAQAQKQAGEAIYNRNKDIADTINNLQRELGQSVLDLNSARNDRAKQFNTFQQQSSQNRTSIAQSQLNIENSQIDKAFARQTESSSMLAETLKLVNEFDRTALETEQALKDIEFEQANQAMDIELEAQRIEFESQSLEMDTQAKMEELGLKIGDLTVGTDGLLKSTENSILSTESNSKYLVETGNQIVSAAELMVEGLNNLGSSLSQISSSGSSTSVASSGAASNVEGYFYTGNSGTSTGAHTDIRVRKADGTWANEQEIKKYAAMFADESGKKLSEYPVTSGRGWRIHPVHGGRKEHHGIDYGTPTGKRLTFTGQATKVESRVPSQTGGGGYTNNYTMPNGDVVMLLHGQRQGDLRLKQIADNTAQTATQSTGVDPKIRAFLDLISYAEGTTKRGYQDYFGHAMILDTTKGHPNVKAEGRSEAAGRYQAMFPTWTEWSRNTGRGANAAMTPANQEAFAIDKLKQRDVDGKSAYDWLKEGNLEKALKATSAEWASFPNLGHPQSKMSNPNSSFYSNQSVKSLSELQAEYNRLLGNPSAVSSSGTQIAFTPVQAKLNRQSYTNSNSVGSMSRGDIQQQTLGVAQETANNRRATLIERERANLERNRQIEENAVQQREVALKKKQEQDEANLAKLEAAKFQTESAVRQNEAGNLQLELQLQEVKLNIQGFDALDYFRNQLSKLTLGLDQEDLKAVNDLNDATADLLNINKSIESLKKEILEEEKANTEASSKGQTVDTRRLDLMKQNLAAQEALAASQQKEVSSLQQVADLLSNNRVQRELNAAAQAKLETTRKAQEKSKFLRSDKDASRSILIEQAEKTGDPFTADRLRREQGLTELGENRDMRDAEIGANFQLSEDEKVQALADSAERYNLEVGKLQESTNTLGNMFSDVVTQPITGFFEDILSGSVSAGEAFRKLIVGMLQNIAQLIIKLLVLRLVKSLVGGFFGGGEVGADNFHDGGTAVQNAYSGGTMQNQLATLFAGGEVPTYSTGGLVAGASISGVPNASALGKALQKEKTMGGGRPVVAVLTAGEEVLSLKNGDAQRFRELKKNGTWDKLKSQSVQNYYNGGQVGSTVNVGGNKPIMTNGNGTTIVNSTHQNIVVKANDPNAFRKSKEQMEADTRNRENRSSRLYGK